MKWCCNSFKSKYENGGKNGVAVLFDEDSNSPFFLLQFRAVDRGKCIELKDDEYFVEVVQFYIDYCPWCGKNIKRFYRSDFKRFVRKELIDRTY